jgi:hypothetical protein
MRSRRSFIEVVGAVAGARAAVAVCTIGATAVLLVACEEPKTAARPRDKSDVRAWEDESARAKTEAAKCARPGMPEGRGRVDMTFGPDGDVTSAAFVTGPYSGTAVGDCVLAIANGMRIPALGHPFRTELRVIVGADSGSWLRPGEVDRFGAREQMRVIRDEVMHECTRYPLEPGTRVVVTLDPKTGATTSAKITSENLGEVGKCIEGKYARVKIEPFNGDPESLEVDLGRPDRATNKLPHP